MKEIRTIKMVEHTEVKFIADDGKEFIGENAEQKCRDYERTRDEKKVETAFKRLTYTELNMPFLNWYGEDYGFYIITLNSKSDYIAMIDYFNVVWHVWDNNISEPKTYPYTMTISAGSDWVCEYEHDIKAELQKVLAQLEG